MSDRWVVFPCAMGEHASWVMVNAGLADRAGELPHRRCAHFMVTLRHPDDRGLPQGDEFAMLDRLEAVLTERLGEECVFAGRITSNGKRYFFFYTTLDQSTVDDRVNGVWAACGYEAGSAYDEDPDWQNYWGRLYPTAADWRVIEDMAVEKALEAKGDDLLAVRQINHWAYFDAAPAARAFAAALGERFPEMVIQPPDSDPGGFVVRFKHEGQPDYRSMNRYTVFATQCASDQGGRYDGWETALKLH